MDSAPGPRVLLAFTLLSLAANAAEAPRPTVPLRGISKGLTKLAVAFTPVENGGTRGEAECVVDGEAWTCSIPQGRYDLRFNASGFAPEYRFGVAAPNGEALRLQFVAGASLSGRLEAARGVRASLENVEVSLSGAQRYTAKAAANGFFQFKGLAPGEYALRAKQGRLVTESRNVTVAADAAAQLAQPLLLDLPRRIAVNIVPRLDPQLKPWNISLWTAAAGSQRQFHAVTQSAASVDGEWSFSGAVGGEYLLLVRRNDGRQWTSRHFTVTASDVTIPLTAFAEHVTGSITLGDRPIAAKLSFDGEDGVALVSDEGGRFEGDLPPSGEDERRIHVDAGELQIVRTVRVKIERSDSGARLDIKLPATSLLGRVVDAKRAPQANAVVTASRTEGTQQIFTKTDGSFQLTGLDAGDYQVFAETANGKSERVAVALKEDAPSEIELVVADQVLVRGRVGLGDMPVINAAIYAIPRDVQWAPFMPRATTNDSGRFELKLPPRTGVTDLIAVHPAFDVVLTRVPVQNDSVRHIVATQIGGTLVAESKTPNELLLRHAGGECWLSWLATLPGSGGSVDAARVTQPRLEPGDYTVCSAKSTRCERGYLAPYGTLTLRVD